VDVLRGFLLLVFESASQEEAFAFRPVVRNAWSPR
jgi:hypothetical protein